MEDLTNEEIVLAGLGQVGARGQQLKKAVRGELGASRYRKHFLERINKLPRNIQKALVNGRAQISDAPYYATAEILGNRCEIIKPSQPEQIGITNIDNGKLGKDRHLVLSAIRLLWDSSSIDGIFTSSGNNNFLNGEWELEINGKKVFEKMPMRKFHDSYYGYRTQNQFGTYVLNNPKIIDPQTPIEFNVNFPDQVPGFLKVFFEGTTVYGY
jgi:hypothetical protein